jgi:hypothetical protein
MKVFATGLNKTGTTSLGKAFRLLGLRTAGLNRRVFLETRYGRWASAFGVTDNHEAFHDWPWGLVYSQMSEAYPDAKFILTLRDPDEWFDSMVRYGKTHSIDTVYRRVYFGIDDPQEEHREMCKGIYISHIQDVQTWFAQCVRQPNRLLCIETNELAWEPICSFLEVPIPDVPFPHVNRSRSPALVGA